MVNSSATHAHNQASLEDCRFKPDMPRRKFPVPHKIGELAKPLATTLARNPLFLQVDTCLSAANVLPEHYVVVTSNGYLKDDIYETKTIALFCLSWLEGNELVEGETRLFECPCQRGLCFSEDVCGAFNAARGPLLTQTLSHCESGPLPGK